MFIYTVYILYIYIFIYLYDKFFQEKWWSDFVNDLQYNVNQQAAGALAADIKNARKLKKKSKKTYVNIRLLHVI